MSNKETSGEKYRLAWGTRWEKWVVIEKDDRDWNFGVTFEALENLGHDACLGYYLCARRIETKKEIA